MWALCWTRFGVQVHLMGSDSQLENLCFRQSEVIIESTCLIMKACYKFTPVKSQFEQMTNSSVFVAQSKYNERKSETWNHGQNALARGSLLSGVISSYSATWWWWHIQDAVTTWHNGGCKCVWLVNGIMKRGNSPW